MLRQGDRSGYKNALAGRWQDLPVKEADYWFSTRVTAPDKEVAVKLIDAGMIQWLLSTGAEFAFAVGGCNLLVSCNQLPATGLVRLFDVAKGFTDHIPHVVWAEYGG